MLLLDQNISDKIVPALQAEFPGTVHVKSVSLVTADDQAIWLYALEHDMAIVTCDDDFQYLSEFRGFPPKVIHLVHGNLSRQQMQSILIANAARIRKFIASPHEGYLAIA
jgi:predicted nuclease of predicted toxin-antitoxin system